MYVRIISFGRSFTESATFMSRTHPLWFDTGAIQL